MAALVLCAIAQAAQASTWTVNSTADPASGTGTPANCAPANANTCTLRDAIAAAANGDTIAFTVGSNQTIALTSNNGLTVANSVSINGSGSPGLTIDGNNTSTIFTISSGLSVQIANLTVANGHTAGNGGGINTSASLTLDHVILASNHAANWGGGIYVAAGAASVMFGVLTANSASFGGGAFAGGGTIVFTDSAFTLNSAASEGGAFFVEYNAANAVSLIRSTVSGNNTAAAGGGAGWTLDLATATLVNSTVSGNNSGFNGDGTVIAINSTVLDGIAGRATLANSIVAGCGVAVAVVDNGGNLDPGTSCGFHDATSSSNATLNLGPLQDNGGPTQTMLPGQGSDAIGAGLDRVCAAAPVNGVDQRGVVRPQGLHCDSGAVEAARALCYVKHDATGANDGSSWSNAYTDLQLGLSDAACDEVWVARGVYKPTTYTGVSSRAISFDIRPGLVVAGGYSGVGAQRDPAAMRTVLSGDIDNNDGGTNGIDADTSQIVGGNSYRVVWIDGTTPAGPVGAGTILDGFTITGGKADDALSAGGGLFCNGSGAVCSPRLNNLVFSGNLAASGGGALYNGGAGGVSSPTISNSTFSGNAAPNGGAIYDDGYGGGNSNPSIVNATFSGNSASSCGGAIYDDASGYGTSSPIIQSATFSGNSADSGNGDGSAICDFTATGINATALTNAIVWGNTSPEISTYSGGMTLDHVVLQENACPSGASCSTAPIGTDPHLGPLQDNGGFTPTRMIGGGSSAIDAGLDSACVGAPVNALDQRGVVRPLGAHCDIGAVEASHLSLNVTDGVAFGFYGKALQYVVTLQNLSATDAIAGVHVSGFGSAALNAAGTLWFCTVGNCTTTQTSGPLADTATLPPNSSLTWLVNVPVFAGSNDASATMTVDSTGASSVTDTDTLAIFRSGFE